MSASKIGLYAVNESFVFGNHSILKIKFSFPLWEFFLLLCYNFVYFKYDNNPSHSAYTATLKTDFFSHNNSLQNRVT